MHGSEPQIARGPNAGIIQSVLREVRLRIGKLRKAAGARIEAVQPALEARHEAAASYRQNEGDLLGRRPYAALSTIRLITMQCTTCNIHEPQRVILRHPDGSLTELRPDRDNLERLRRYNLRCHDPTFATRTRRAHRRSAGSQPAPIRATAGTPARAWNSLAANACTPATTHRI